MIYLECWKKMLIRMIDWRWMNMKYDKQNYIGKSIQLYPGDTVKKYGKILNVDDLGWTIEITNVNSCNDTYTTGDVIFISHSKSFVYKIL